MFIYMKEVKIKGMLTYAKVEIYFWLEFCDKFY